MNDTNTEQVNKLLKLLKSNGFTIEPIPATFFFPEKVLMYAFRNPEWKVEGRIYVSPKEDGTQIVADNYLLFSTSLPYSLYLALPLPSSLEQEAILLNMLIWLGEDEGFDYSNVETKPQITNYTWSRP